LIYLLIDEWFDDGECMNSKEPVLDYGLRLADGTLK